MQARSINGKRRLKSEKHSILYNTTISPIQAFSPLRCGKEHQILRNGVTNTLSDERYYGKKHTFMNTESLMSAPPASSHVSSSFITNNNLKINTNSNNSTYTTKTEKFDVKYRLNRKLGMLVIISGFYTRDEK